jgi:hypothetical protein
MPASPWLQYHGEAAAELPAAVIRLLLEANAPVDVEGRAIVSIGGQRAGGRRGPRHRLTGHVMWTMRASPPLLVRRGLAQE